jgi:hypothetical protein
MRDRCGSHLTALRTMHPQVNVNNIGMMTKVFLLLQHFMFLLFHSEYVVILVITYLHLCSL